MRLAVLGVLALGVEAAAAATLALWPQQLDATLSVSTNADGSSVVETSSGGVLGTFNTKIDTQSEERLDPLVDAIEITWVPASAARSTVFDRYLANSALFDTVNAVGIHLHVKLVDGAVWSEINETHHERIEENVRVIKQNLLPTLGKLPELSKGFLAKSLCDFRSWETSDPLQESFLERDDRSLSLCYSSSFPLSPETESTAFLSKFTLEDEDASLDSRISGLERSLLEAKRSFSSIQREYRFAAVKLGRDPASSKTIKAEYLESWLAGPSRSAKSWKTVLPSAETSTDLLAVKSITRQGGLGKLEYSWIQLAGTSVAPGTSSSVEIQAPNLSALAAVQTAITGEGFHRRYVMDVKVLESEAFDTASQDKTLLVRVPVPTTAYIDLDEIRRMERFGELKLLSFTKHIEIERPSPVSSQHVSSRSPGVVYGVISPPTNEVRVEFPIHFRYQAPSESELYRQASVLAPDMFLFIRSGDQSAATKPKTSEDGHVQSYLQTWGLLDEEEQTASRSSSHWIRLTTESPLPVIEVLTPVGFLPSDWLVSSVTLLFASMGAALLLWLSVGRMRTESSLTTAEATWKAKTE